MAVYKVPQDVEADDKLIGPFSFRQFIYLIIVAISGFIAFMLSKIFIALLIIPVPIMIFFGALALPLRKDQPMETYLVAVVRFMIKPRVRMWSPEGSVSMVTITAPKTLEQHLTKDFSGDEAAQRLSYLAQVVDTGGWATRGVINANDAMNDIFVAEAQSTTDILDASAPVSRSFDNLIVEQDAQRKQQAIQSLQQPANTSLIGSLQEDTVGTGDIDFDPYPTSMHQRVISPQGRAPVAPVVAAQPQVAPIAPAPQLQQSAPSVNTSVPQYSTPAPVTNSVPSVPSPVTIRLANTKDLSISALAHEAHRLTDTPNDEVVISLH